MTKEERREAMPLSSAFIDEMRSLFGEITAISAEENGQSVKWGEDWKDTVEFEAAK